jgi:hypothetical protein
MAGWSAAHVREHVARPSISIDLKNMIFIIIALVLFIIGIGMFLQKVRLKSKMEGGLGRKVKDSELTSLSAWMDASSSKSGNARGGKQE